MVEVITTDAEYNTALDLAWELMDAEPGSPECDELERLVSIIMVWEDGWWK